MIIKRLSVTNVRSHQQRVIDLSPHTTVIIGKNGIGKTSLLEAVYVALQGTSFKGSDADILQHDAPWYRIDILLDDDTVRTVTFDPSRTSGRKRFVVHDTTSYRLRAKDKYPVVLFEPEDLRLLHGSPTRRRQFIDRFIAQIEPTYSTTLRKYERALKQRNTLLKQDRVSGEDLFVWNVTLSESGAEIIDKRVYATQLLNKELSYRYGAIAGSTDTVTAHYSHTSIDNTAQKLLRELEMATARDKILAHTSVGPHRHDVLFRINDHPAISVASRGEIRTVLLALKLQEIETVYGLTGNHPFVLFDDIYSELDKDRQAGIEAMVTGRQAIITSTHTLHQQDETRLVVEL